MKIDGCFVKEVATDPFARVTVESVCRVAEIMKIETVAEFVEDDTCLSVLQELGVDLAQGYGIGKPQPIDEQLAQLRAVDGPNWMVA